MQKLKISLFAEEIRRFFSNMVIDTMKEREARNIIRPDMIHLLMEAKKGSNTINLNKKTKTGGGADKIT